MVWCAVCDGVQCVMVCDGVQCVMVWYDGVQCVMVQCDGVICVMVCSVMVCDGVQCVMVTVLKVQCWDHCTIYKLSSKLSDQCDDELDRVLIHTEKPHL